MEIQDCAPLGLNSPKELIIMFSLVTKPVHSNTNSTSWGPYSPAAIKVLETIQPHKRSLFSQVPIHSRVESECTSQDTVPHRSGQHQDHYWRAKQISTSFSHYRPQTEAASMTGAHSRSYTVVPSVGNTFCSSKAQHKQSHSWTKSLQYIKGCFWCCLSVSDHVKYTPWNGSPEKPKQ